MESAASGLHRIARTPAEDDSTARFLLDVLRALHAHGMPSHRLEAMADALAEHLDTEAHFFTTPTALFVALGPAPAQRTYLVRADEGEIDLAKLRTLDEIANDVAEGRATPAEGSRRVESVLARPSPPAPVSLAAHASLAAGAAVLLGGGVHEAAVASISGLAVGLLDLVALHSQALRRLFLPSAALASASVAALATLVWPELARSVATVAGLIILVPGFALTTAMIEIATGHLVSGTSRLSKALVAFLLLGLGAALGAELGELVPAVTSGGEAARLGAGWTWGAALVSLPALGVLLRADPRDAVAFGGAALVAFGAVQLASLRLEPALAAGAGALVLGLLGNAFARYRDRPAAIVLVPGLLLLVPGSLGFRSVTHFLADDVLVAVGTAFDVALVAAALVGGLLVASLGLPPRKAL